MCLYHPEQTEPVDLSLRGTSPTTSTSGGSSGSVSPASPHGEGRDSPALRDAHQDDVAIDLSLTKVKGEVMSAKVKVTYFQ